MRSALIFVVLTWLLGVLDFGLAPHMALFGIRPDFLLLGTIIFSQLLSRPASAGVGFFAGLINGAIGANLTHYVLSRTVTAFAGSWFRASQRGQSTVQIMVTVFIGTIFCNFIFLFTAAPHNVGRFLADTIIAAIYNGVLAAPLYALLSRYLGLNNRQRL
jgi:rod shape-determining protein MreD